MRPQTHFIGKQKLLFDFTSEQRARSWTKDSNTFFQEQILPVLSRVFDDLPTDKWYALDYLEIDLGEIPVKDVGEVLLQSVSKALRELLPDSTSIPGTSPILKKKFSPAANRPQQPSASGQVIVKNYPEVLMGLFFEFLDHGVVQRQAAFRNLEELEDALLKVVGAEGLVLNKDFERRMDLVQSRMRLDFQFSRSFSTLLFRASFPNELKLIRDFQQVVSQRLASLFDYSPSTALLLDAVSVDPVNWLATTDAPRREDLPKVLLDRLMGRIFTVAAMGSDAVLSTIVLKLLSIDDHAWPAFPRVTKLVKSSRFVRPQMDALRKISGLEDSVLPSLSEALDTSPPVQPEPSRPPDDPDDPTYTMQLPGEEASPPHGDMPPQLSDAKPSGRGEELRIDVPKEGTDQIAEWQKSTGSHSTQRGDPDREQGFEREAQTVKEKPDAYYVQFAGIVLCWPYLQQLFDRCGYLYRSDFKNETAQERAIHLLGYVATGRERCPEYLLVLQKFMVGWPLEMPVRRKIKLLRREKKEAERMLGSLIKNWSILKNTSIEGLRSSFFQRDGKLIRSEHGWQLIVEQKSYDMVLDYLPYSLSLIKLPWRKNIFKVDWA